MPQVLSGLDLQSILERIGHALRTEHDKITNEPLPSRWVDLIHYLDDKDRQQAASRKPETEAPVDKQDDG